MAGREVASVVNRCNEAKEDNKLDLSSCQLTSIPDAIYLLMMDTELRCCTLSHNLLKRLPSKFTTKFNLLNELDLSKNHLSNLPEEMKQMENLIMLDISHNEFSSLPSVIYKLNSLKKLSAEKNAIIEIDIQRLQSLRNIAELNLQDNPLTTDTCHQLSLLTNKITVLLTSQESDADSV